MSKVLYRELMRVQKDANAQLKTADGIKIAAKAVNAITALCEYSRYNGWIKIDGAFKDTDILSAPLLAELKFITQRLLEDEDKNDIWTYYYSGAYTGIEAFVYLFYVYMAQFAKEEIGARLAKSIAIFLMPKTARRLLPDEIAEQKAIYIQNEKDRKQRAIKSQNVSFEDVLKEWQDPARENPSNYFMLNYAILNMPEKDLQTFISENNGAHISQPLFNAISGDAAKRLIAALPETALSALREDFTKRTNRPYGYYENEEALEKALDVLLRLIDEGRVTIPGDGTAFMNFSQIDGERDISCDGLKDLFFRMGKYDIPVLAEDAPYELANSSIMDNKEARARIEKNLLPYVLEYVDSKRDKYISLFEITENDIALRDKIVELASYGLIRVGVSRNYAEE